VSAFQAQILSEPVTATSILQSLVITQNADAYRLVLIFMKEYSYGAYD
jgi:hypothetical protein